MSPCLFRATTRVARARAFTLIEICVATIIIGVAITALMTAIASGTRINDAGQNLTEGIFLTQEVREYTVKLPYSSLTALKGGAPFSPPIDGRGQPMSQFSEWSQAVTITYMEPASPTTVTATPSDLVRVTVTILRNNVQVMATSWLVARKVSD